MEVEVKWSDVFSLEQGFGLFALHLMQMEVAEATQCVWSRYQVAWPIYN